MDAKMKALLEGFQNNLNQTVQQQTNAKAQLEMLTNKIEQLKGAIFALQELEAQLAVETAAPTDAKAPTKEANGKKGNGKKDAAKADTKQAAEVTETKAEEKAPEAASGAQS